jgi:CRISPR-associated protein Cmr5
MSTQTLSQRRAKHAWSVVERLRVAPDFDEFCDQAKKLPMRALTSGLGQSLAFLRSKGKAPELLAALTSWMQEYEKGTPAELLDRITQGDSEFQRLATAECLSYLEWLVRFADAHKE